MTALLTLLVAYVLATIATARLTRLVVHDSYPPAAAFRRWWFNQTVAKGGWRAGWAPLVSGDDGTGGCPFCASPYLAVPVLAVGIAAGVWEPDLATLAGWGWLLAVGASLSSLAAILVVRAEPVD